MRFYLEMLFVLGLAYIFDLWREYTSGYFLETSNNLFGIYLSYLITTIILSFAIICWIIRVMRNNDHNVIVYILFLMPSVLIILYPLVFYNPEGFSYWIYRLSPSSQAYLVSGIIIIIGLWKIILPLRHSRPNSAWNQPGFRMGVKADDYFDGA
jgi:hypothetical protein